MQAQLVAIEGPLRGGVWPIGSEGITLGRDRACTVRLRDRLASRRHCRVFPDQGRMRIEDLGARNPVLVEGEPRRGGIVRIGDTLAVGGELFILAGPPSAGLQAAEGSDETLSLGHYLALHLPGDHTIRLERHVSTVEQLALLFEAVTRMAACDTATDLVTAGQEALLEWMKPAGFWMARPRQGPRVTFYARWPEDQDAGHGLPGAVCKAMDEQKPILLPAGEEGRGSFVLAPLSLNSASLGSIVLESAATPYRNADLRVLQLFSMVFAAFLESLRSHDQLKRDNERLRMRAGESLEFVGESDAARNAREQAMRAARSNLNVLIFGETGTGKELLARMVHQLSARAAGPFVVVNCAAIPDALFESQFFGHARGAFTGADTSFEGLLGQADGGTLLLDEVADLSAHNQARILRAIEYGVYHRLGESEERSVDVRVLAATNKDIHAAIGQDAFREDLYHRLNGFEIVIPPLRERAGDIPLLARHFFELGRGMAYRPLEGIAGETLACLSKQPWPGNVRELRNTVLRGISLATEAHLLPGDVSMPGAQAARSEAGPAALTLKEAEKQHIERVLREQNNNMPAAAKHLGIARSTLYKKVADLGIDT